MAKSTYPACRIKTLCIHEPTKIFPNDSSTIQVVYPAWNMKGDVAFDTKGFIQKELQDSLLRPPEHPEVELLVIVYTGHELNHGIAHDRSIRFFLEFFRTG